MGSVVPEFNRYVYRVFTGTLLVTVAAAGGLLAAGLRPWSRGVALGGAVSLFGLAVMAADVRRRGAGAAGGTAVIGRYALRMTATAAALVYAAISPRIALWGVVPALFIAQAVMTAGEVVGGDKRG